MSDKYNKLTLAIAIALPLLMVIVIASSIYLPSKLLKPQHNFLYLSGGTDYYSDKSNAYFIDDKGQLQIRDIYNPQKYPQLKGKTANIFLYDFKTNTGRQITIEDAQLYKLDSSNLSPDGFEVIQGDEGGNVFSLIFSGNRNNNIYLTNGKINKKLNINPGSRYYSFEFLGWVI